MEVVIAVQSGELVHALRIMQRRRVPTPRGGGHDEIPQAVQKKSRPPSSDRMAPFASELLLEHGFGLRKANVTERFFLLQETFDLQGGNIKLR